MIYFVRQRQQQRQLQQHVQHGSQHIWLVASLHMLLMEPSVIACKIHPACLNHSSNGVHVLLMVAALLDADTSQDCKSEH
jgi:hypothetical protein